MMVPLEEKRIESKKDIVESGIPWDMTLYGGDIEDDLRKSKDPILRKIWTDKIVSPFNPSLNLSRDMSRVKFSS